MRDVKAGAYVSGLELATLAGRSPIMFNQGQANPYGHVQVSVPIW